VLTAVEAFMELEDFELIQMELKYCERCGGLWLRVRGSGEVYCASCVVEMTDPSVLHYRKSQSRLPANHKVDIKTQGIDLAAICGEGGNA
jgi:Zn-finger nucleic acid-binding protein